MTRSVKFLSVTLKGDFVSCGCGLRFFNGFFRVYKYARDGSCNGIRECLFTICPSDGESKFTLREGSVDRKRFTENKGFTYFSWYLPGLLYLQVCYQS